MKRYNNFKVNEIKLYCCIYYLVEVTSVLRTMQRYDQCRLSYDLYSNQRLFSQMRAAVLHP